MTDLPGHDGKVTSDINVISISYQVYNDGNRDYFSHFSMTIETTGKFVIVSVRLILGKMVVDGFTALQREINVK